MHQFMIAAPHSGTGKTVVTAGLITALKQRGYVVQPFKVGPDYIDPTYHKFASGRHCPNLDSWILPEHAIDQLYRQHTADCDIAIVEGVMGLFDGYGVTDEGSSAAIAKQLDLPIILLINARGMSRSAAALVHGYHTFDRATNIAGVILNRVGSQRHADLLTAAIEQHTNIPVIGHIPRDDRFTFPERHLGLIPTSEQTPHNPPPLTTLNLDKLLTLTTSTPHTSYFIPHTSSSSSCRIALAEDEAFSFTYPENRMLLEQAGAEIIPFSPIHDTQLPEQIDGIILSGGFPELYAAQLSANRPMLAQIREAAESNLPIYAECGGLMLLTEAIIDQAGVRYSMAAVLPGISRMTDKVTLGYRTVTALHDTPVMAQGATIRGHEFHYSVWENRPDHLPYMYTVQARTGQSETKAGAIYKNVYASYIHLHFMADPHIAPRFVNLLYCRHGSLFDSAS